jgi:altronate hydrolase
MSSAAVIQLHPKDSVVIARASLLPGTPVGEGVTAAERVPPGHKVAVVPVPPGEPVRRYNQIIGFATQAIAPGQHVHVHNMGMGDFVKDYAFGADAKPTVYVDQPATIISAS